MFLCENGSPLVPSCLSCVFVNEANEKFCGEGRISLAVDVFIHTEVTQLLSTALEREERRIDLCNGVSA